MSAKRRQAPRLIGVNVLNTQRAWYRANREASKVAVMKGVTRNQLLKFPK